MPSLTVTTLKDYNWELGLYYKQDFKGLKEDSTDNFIQLFHNRMMIKLKMQKDNWVFFSMTNIKYCFIKL